MGVTRPLSPAVQRKLRDFTPRRALKAGQNGFPVSAVGLSANGFRTAAELGNQAGSARYVEQAQVQPYAMITPKSHLSNENRASGVSW